MIGYHYTTQKAWEQVQYGGGMQLTSMRQFEYDKFIRTIPTLPRDIIWVWKEKLIAEHAFIVSLLVSEMHLSFDIVLLRIEYEESISAAIVCRPNAQDFVKLTCDFSAGRLATGKLPVDLILDYVPVSNIMRIGQHNMLEPFAKQSAAA